MPRNANRRNELADAGLRVLARDGSRGLSHRAVDAEAGAPVGTASNYFRSRSELLAALGERIFDRLTPDEAARAESAAKRPSRVRWKELMRELRARVLAEPSLQVALLELRLEATRHPELAAALTRTLRRSLDADLAFQREAGLPGGRTEVVLLHLAMEGLFLNATTLPEVLDVQDDDHLVDRLVDRLVPATRTGRG